MKGRTHVSAWAMVMALAGIWAVEPAAAQGRPAASPVPDGFVKYMVFMMNGVFDPRVPAEDTAEFYQKSIRGRNDAEIEEHRAEAADGAHLRSRECTHGKCGPPHSLETTWRIRRHADMEDEATAPGRSVTMNKVLVLVLADTETKEALGRVVNALQTAKEFRDAEDEINLLFDGAGTRWIGELAAPDHKYHALFESVKDRDGACSYCAGAFSVKAAVEKSGVSLLDEFEGHPSLRRAVSDGYQVISF